MGSGAKIEKRKVEQNLAPKVAQEDRGGRQDSQDTLAPVVLVDTNSLDGGIQRKRAKVAEKIRAQKG